MTVQCAQRRRLLPAFRDPGDALGPLPTACSHLLRSAARQRDTSGRGPAPGRPGAPHTTRGRPPASRPRGPQGGRVRSARPDAAPRGWRAARGGGRLLPGGSPVGAGCSGATRRARHRCAGPPPPQPPAAAARPLPAVRGRRPGRGRPSPPSSPGARTDERTPRVGDGGLTGPHPKAPPGTRGPPRGGRDRLTRPPWGSASSVRGPPPPAALAAPLETRGPSRSLAFPSVFWSLPLAVLPAPPPPHPALRVVRATEATPAPGRRGVRRGLQHRGLGP